MAQGVTQLQIQGKSTHCDSWDYHSVKNKQTCTFNVYVFLYKQYMRLEKIF